MPLRAAVSAAPRGMGRGDVLVGVRGAVAAGFHELGRSPCQSGRGGARREAGDARLFLLHTTRCYRPRTRQAEDDVPLRGHGPYALSTGIIHSAGHSWRGRHE